MKLALLADIGSTFTKVTAVQLESGTVLGTARAFTTVESDVMEGFLNAVQGLERSIGLRNPPYKFKVACSSAAGGLQMIAIGLVPGLTAEAAKRAALGAGARITGVFAHELSRVEVGRIEEQDPDIILLAGGTDGGNKKVIIHNARMLAGALINAPIVVAGNKAAVEEVERILSHAGKDLYVTENVMPELNVLNIDPARQVIREVFLKKIVAAKGLKKIEQVIDGVLMPTPAAVLRAAELLYAGFEGESGLGELMVVDVGGATTDVHSVAGGEPTKAGVTLKGLPEPLAKRTVEGDLGMRYSARALLEAAGLQRLLNRSGLKPEDFYSYIEAIEANPGIIFDDVKGIQIEALIGFTAVDIATERHVGRIEVCYTPFGVDYIQTGKDLTGLNYVIGTGGVFSFHSNPLDMLKGVLFDQSHPTVLKPQKPKLMLDKAYILAGMGLLGEIEPLAAVKIAKKHLAEI